MSELLPPWPLLSALLVASLALAISPGPGVFYIVTRSLTDGPKSGLISVVGVSFGNLCNVLTASIGLAAILCVSSTAFTVVKYIGALYLIYLGIRTLRCTHRHDVRLQPKHLHQKQIFRDAFIVAFFNPKTTLFFGAFLPQFMTPDAPALLQSILLGSIFVVIATLTDSLYALGIGIASRTLSGIPRIREFGRYLTAGTFIGLGVFTASDGPEE